MKSILETYPKYHAEIEDIKQNGLTLNTLRQIIKRHASNANRSRLLYDRYQTLDYAVPIYNRQPRFESEEDAINNKVMNDFFSEIVDVKVGYFAGNPVTYGYSSTRESEEDTGGVEAVDLAQKTITDFTTLNNFHDVDIETTKIASICGYVGRLFYIDSQGQERVLVTMPWETIVLSDTSIMEPEFGIRYLRLQDLDGRDYYHVDFYDETNITSFEGFNIDSLEQIGQKPHLFDFCPLQGIPNNLEMMGDTERVEELINAYDNAMSDSNNEIESFASAYMVYENVNMSEEEIAKAQKSGAIRFYTGGGNGKVYFLTKQINDGFIEHHLDRLQDNIYRFSKTPNLNDNSFGTASGVSLKFKITGLETKCGMFEAKMKTANVYMFRLLATSWAKKRINIDPLQCTMEFKRNFPLDLASEAQSCATLIGAGLPKRVAFSQLSFVDDVDYIMDMIKEEEDGIPDLDSPDSSDSLNNTENGIEETEEIDKKNEEEGENKKGKTGFERINDV